LNLVQYSKLIDETENKKARSRERAFFLKFAQKKRTINQKNRKLAEKIT